MNRAFIKTKKSNQKFPPNTEQIIYSRSAGCGVFVRGAFLSLFFFLLLGFAVGIKANVIQANQTYPPPNGSFRSPGTAYNFGAGGTAVRLNDVAFTFFDNFVLPSGTTTISFTAQCSHRLSVNGGGSFSGEQAATATFNVTLTPAGPNIYTFQINSLTINGGDLPAAIKLRKPAGALPGSPVVTFTPNTPTPGLFSIDNTFYLPLELSQDGGVTWTSNTVSGTYGTPAFTLSPLTSEEVTHAPTLPPGDGHYYTADQYHAAFANGIVIRNPIHNGFLGQSCTDTNNSGQPGLTNVLCPPPLLGNTDTEDFTSQMSFDLQMPGLVHIGPIGASVETRVSHTHDSGGLQIFRAQMLQLNPNLGSLPAGMNFRINPDPNKPSLGMTTMRPGAGPNDTNISSAFALRLQMTTDNGATWLDSLQFTRMSLRVLSGTGFPTTPTNGQTFSIGVFRVVVDPSYAFLFGPSNSSSYYPGYGGTNGGILTSPVMYDGNTMIGESVSHSSPASVFPVVVGTPDQYPPNSTYSNIMSYGDYAYIPPLFANAPAGVDEMFTEIEQMNLQGYANKSDSNGTACYDPRVPSVSSQTQGQLVTVKAGPGAFGIGPSLPLNRRSIGMVQQLMPGTPTSSDFPAQSFFNIYVVATLPKVPGTVAFYDFPAGGAVLYNDVNNPLLIQNFMLTNLPPEATYIHGNTTAVPIRFRDSNPPYWSANDVLGYLTLAGHGVFTNVVTASAPCAAATSAGGLLDQTLGPIGNPIAAPPIPWLRSTNAFPTPNTGYGSTLNRPVDIATGITNILDDTVTFVVPSAGLVTVRDIKFGNLGGAIPPPAPLTSSTYNNTFSTANSCEISIQNGLSDPGFYPATGGSAAGTTSMVISNTGSGNPANYDIELLEYSGGGNIIGGEFDGWSVILRESPTPASLGEHTIAPDPRGYRVSSFIDAYLELSLDGGATWTPANSPIRLHASSPPPIPQSLFVTKVFKQGQNTRMVIEWQNGFTLQSATSLLGPWVDMPGVKGPYTNTASGTLKLYRLRQ